MNLKQLAASSIVAALYIAVTALIAPFGFTNIQFRLSEILNHLVVFNKKYFFGIVLGVFISNAFFSKLGPIDLVFGVGHTILALSITIISAKFIQNVYKRMFFNTIVFSFTMFIIAFQLHLVNGFPFFWTWLYTAISEWIVMLIGIPIMGILHKRLQLDKLIESK